MSLLRWPPELPQHVQRPGFDWTLPDGRQSIEPEAGPMLGRLAFSATETPIAASIDVTLRQVARFLRFWNEETGGGVRPFLLRDQIWDGLPVLTSSGTILLDSSGAPVLTRRFWLCVFGRQPPKPDPLGGPNYRIAFTLRVLPR